MSFLNILGILAAGGIGVAAGGMLDFSFKNKISLQKNNQQSMSIPQIQVQGEKSEPVLIFDDSLNRDQVDVLKVIWRKIGNNSKYLIDYFDYKGWVDRAKQYSVVKEKGPGDIIFIEDKSDKNLGEKLRDKCYSAAQGFFIGNSSDNNVDVESFMKNIYKKFSFSNVIDLCSVNNDTSSNDIKNVKRTQMQSTGTYTCKHEATSSEQGIEEVYKVKKDYYSDGGTMCQAIKETPVIEIEYKDGTKKYQFLKSRKNSSGSGYESTPGDGTIYSSILEIPGLSDLFELKK